MIPLRTQYAVYRGVDVRHHCEKILHSTHIAPKFHTVLYAIHCCYPWIQKQIKNWSMFRRCLTCCQQPTNHGIIGHVLLIVQCLSDSIYPVQTLLHGNLTYHELKLSHGDFGLNWTLSQERVSHKTSTWL